MGPEDRDPGPAPEGPDEGPDGGPEGACLSDEDLAMAVAGEAPPEESARVHRHVARCAACMTLFAALGRTSPASSPATDPAAGPAAGPASSAALGRTWDRLPASGDGAPVPESFAEFQILRLLGRGAMGAVYLARDRQLQRAVAIKFIQTLHTRGVRRFEKEARAAARVSHPNVVTLHKVGEHLGVPYQVSEHVEGRTLGELPLPLPEAEVRAIAQGLCAGLAAIHEGGIVHRDIKPQNVMRTAAGQVKILDFGLARLLEALGELPEDEGRETRDGALIGTPRYMAPEALRGAAATKRSDVYSLGVLLYELLSGAPPGPALPPRPPAGVSEGLHALIARCLEADPARRFEDGAAVLGALAALEGGRSAPLNLWRKIERWRPSLSPGARLAAGALLVAGAVAGARWWPRRGAGGPAAGPAGSAAPRPALSGMVWLSGGAFPMGRGAEELDGECRFLGAGCLRDKLDREQPPRLVHLSPFYLDQREVSNQAFVVWLESLPLQIEVREDRDTGVPRFVYLRPDRVRGGEAILLLDLGPSQNSLRYEGGAFSARPGHEQLPVVRVTWDGARRYCVAQGKRLPTEAEWERAARGQSARRFPWGDERPSCAGVTFDRHERGTCAAEPRGPRPVGTSPLDVTPEGVFDLGGNVTEWVEDAFLRPYYLPCGACQDPRQDSDAALPDDLRVIRGCGWEGELTWCRASARARWARGDSLTGLGFRCATR